MEPTFEQKLQIIKMLLDSIKDWRTYDKNANSPAIPDSVCEVIKILFPRGI